MNKLQMFLFNTTYKIWHPVVVRVLVNSYEHGLIKEHQMYNLLSQFDRTQANYLGVTKLNRLKGGE